MRSGNPQRCETFYVDQLGFKLSDWLGDFFVFLRCNVDHHTMNFITARKPGMFHVACEPDDAGHLTRACDILGLNKIELAWASARRRAPAQPLRLSLRSGRRHHRDVRRARPHLERRQG